MTRRLVGLAVVLGLSTLGLGRARADLLGPTPYLSFNDSPFVGQVFDYFHLEDFEGGALATPGASATSGWTVGNPGALTDSVDADDGVIDGSGVAGHSFYSGFTNSTLTITFDATALGGKLPTHAGIVWTDVGQVLSGDFAVGGVLFSAIDGNGNSIGSIGPFTLGDGSAAGETAEDRFFGAISSLGIKSITISMDNSLDWEVDHLQYGFSSPLAIPEPSSLLLTAIGLLTGGVWWRQSRVSRGG